MKNLKIITVIKEIMVFAATTISLIGFGFTFASHAAIRGTAAGQKGKIPDIRAHT